MSHRDRAGNPQWVRQKRRGRLGGLTTEKLASRVVVDISSPTSADVSIGFGWSMFSVHTRRKPSMIG